MSRVAKNPIKIVDGVNVTVEGNIVTVKGSKEELEFEMTESISLNIAEDTITVVYDENIQQSLDLAGTTRSIVNNKIIDVA